MSSITIAGDVNEALGGTPGRFKVRDCQDVRHMHYVVWDTLSEQPVAYSAHWVDACLTARRWEAHHPFDARSLQ